VQNEPKGNEIGTEKKIKSKRDTDIEGEWRGIEKIEQPLTQMARPAPHAPLGSRTLSEWPELGEVFIKR